MRFQLKCFLLIFMATAVNAEQVKTLFNPFTNKPDYITKLSSETLPSGSTQYIWNTDSLQTGATAYPEYLYASTGTFTNSLNLGDPITGSAGDMIFRISGSGITNGNAVIEYRHCIFGLCSTLWRSGQLNITSGNFGIYSSAISTNVVEIDYSNNSVTHLNGPGGANVRYNMTAGSVTVSNIPSGECVQTTTGGLLSGTGAACGSGGGTPGGSSGNVQYNNAGSFGGAAFLNVTSTATLTSADMEFASNSIGPVLTDSDGCRWRTTVATTGNLITTSIGCPVVASSRPCRRGMSLGLLLSLTCS